jgi:hypothetical protein
MMIMSRSSTRLTGTSPSIVFGQLKKRLSQADPAVRKSFHMQRRYLMRLSNLRDFVSSIHSLVRGLLRRMVFGVATKAFSGSRSWPGLPNKTVVV